MKNVTITAFFPEVPSSHAYQTARGSGSNLALAIYRATKALLKSPNVKGRKLHTMKFTIAVVQPEPQTIWTYFCPRPTCTYNVACTFEKSKKAFCPNHPGEILRVREEDARGKSQGQTA